MAPPVVTAGLARWAELAQALRARIVAGEWKSGDALPAESALAAAHGVALGTMRAAIQALADEGLVERLHGRGTFVRGALTVGSLSRFFRWGTGGDGGLPGSRVLSVKVVKPPVEVARALWPAEAPGPAALRLLRLRLRPHDARPLLHETIHLALPAFDALRDLAPAEFPALLYPMYAERCNVTVHRALDDLAFERLSAPLARALALPAGAPAIRVTRTACDLAGRVVEHRVTRGNAEDFHYRAEVR